MIGIFWNTFCTYSHVWGVQSHLILWVSPLWFWTLQLFCAACWIAECPSPNVLFHFPPGSEALLVMIGTKLDLVTANSKLRQVQVQEAKNFASSHHIIEVLETSSKDNTNIEKTFVQLAKALKKKHDGFASQTATEESIRLETRNIGLGVGGVHSSRSCSC